MQIKNPNAEKNQVESKVSLRDFGRAMAQLDLKGVPPEKRSMAVMDHLARVMGEEVTDPALRLELRISRKAREKAERLRNGS